MPLLLLSNEHTIVSEVIEDRYGSSGFSGLPRSLEKESNDFGEKWKG